jgi:hypothetical protein
LKKKYIVFTSCSLVLLNFADIQRKQKLTAATHCVKYHTFHDGFLRQELQPRLQPSFDDGLTCCGFRCGFFGFEVDFHLCQILFELGSSAPIHDTILRCESLSVSSRQHKLWTSTFFSGNQFFSPLFRASQAF